MAFGYATQKSAMSQPETGMLVVMKRLPDAHEMAVSSPRGHLKITTSELPSCRRSGQNRCTWLWIGASLRILGEEESDFRVPTSLSMRERSDAEV
jgi:hypothetical protein